MENPFRILNFSYFLKLRVVYSGIETAEFEREDLVEKRADNELRLLFVGYLTQAKGAFDLSIITPYRYVKQIILSMESFKIKKFIYCATKAYVDKVATYAQDTE